MTLLPSVTLGAFCLSIRSSNVLTPPTEVGATVDPMLNRVEKWGMEAWAAYYLPWGLPVLLAFLIVIQVARKRRELQQQAGVTEILQYKHRVKGHVVDVSVGNVKINGRSLVRFTVKFTERDGIERYVTKRKPMHVSETPKLDQTVAVVYDPAGDENKIVIFFSTSDI
ncbi:hypothetical protein GTY86_31390, partial [Streptomyces sp. SID5770]|uniref:hypothetical protein n=1 Tax=Streptomyces sp. SID5770 TaxID=2690308 RepID=UPI0013849D00